MEMIFKAFEKAEEEPSSGWLYADPLPPDLLITHVDSLMLLPHFLLPAQGSSDQ